MDHKKAPSPFAVLWGWASGEHGGFYASVALAVLGVACGMVPYFCVAAMIGLLLEGGGLADCLPWCGLALAGYGGKALFSTWSTSLSHTATYHTLRRVRQNLLSKLSRVPMGTILDTPSGQYKTTIVDRVEGMEPTLAHLLPEMTSNLLVPVSIAVYIFVLDWRMGLASLVTTVIGFAVASQSSKTYAVRWQGAVEVGRRMANAIVEYVGGIQVVKAFNQATDSYRKYADAVRSFKDYTMGWFRSTWVGMNLMASIMPTTLLGVVPAGLWLYFEGALAPSELAMCVILALSIVDPITRFTSFVNEMKSMEYAVSDTREFLDLPELAEPDGRAETSGASIALDHVSFSYDGGNEVIHDVSLRMPQGSFCALVGPSGSGKSTLARLIARHWDVQGGSVSVGGVDVRKMPLDQLSELVSFVAQDNYLFDATIRENIRLGRPQATDEEGAAAARAACCEEFVKRLPQGIDTPAGEAGGALSGGERQRISIARAILKDAPIVLLDEATAFTDPENEDKIQRSIARLAAGKTLVVIAHRLSTITSADCIVVIDQGRIVDQGKHRELLGRCPLYARMWQAHIGAKAWAAGSSDREGSSR